MRAAASSLNTFKADGSFLEQFQSREGSAGLDDALPKDSNVGKLDSQSVPGACG